ncbi:PhzF family phenazine biosynthesis protein [Simiduia curdlanivorans]|uniref:PhzF family phenazine biosynthesis protein n=1 Tax=Simiduia curdlanivorans TaxID=1492769 RepID=A0ABV8VAN2_9GAMM|nr:PhzF family phenazine biosynthesis protein [Simiduia curdlanivorans]MDN3639112.1 PhzF family phenazine biosynthesis protein [Simiduia curdlanivorans]
MKLNIWQVDAFTNTVFSGNYAAVIILDSWLTDTVMQNIASENNVSETAFLVKTNDATYAIRWFSPLKEIDFCGHATLAAAFVLYRNHKALERLTFTAPAVGSLGLVKQANGFIEMAFPNRQPALVESVPAPLLEGLSIKPVAVLKNTQAYFAVLASRAEVENVAVDLAKVKLLAPLDLVVTAADSEVDFVSRYFWPANGGDEDPVTGSAHAGLAPYWADQLGKAELKALQVSKRGGQLQCRVVGDKVNVAGQAVLYMEGVINI